MENRRAFVKGVAAGIAALVGSQALPVKAQTGTCEDDLAACQQQVAELQAALAACRGYDGVLSGDVGPFTVPVGEHWHIDGDINLTGDLIVEGLLTGIDTFRIDGNRYEIVVQHGGQLDLAGVPKTGWVRWGETSTGWDVGDDIVVAPTTHKHPGIATQPYHRASVTTWEGDWTATTRPSGTAWGAPFNCESVVDSANRTWEPEVGNLTRSIVIDNVDRIMFHMGSGVQTLKHLAITNSGVFNQSGFYALHWHFNGDTSRGSVVEGVVVDRCAAHAFVPHASHGITFTDCVAHDVKEDAYWWDPPGLDNDASITDDITYDHCLAIGVVQPKEGSATSHERLTAFAMTGGKGNVARDCAAAIVYGGHDASGFSWPEKAGKKGAGSWVFEDNVAHNCHHGIHVWQNNGGKHHVQTFTGFNNGNSSIFHGAYLNNYTYDDCVVGRVRLHALSWEGSGSHPDNRQQWNRLTCDRKFFVHSHRLSAVNPVRIVDSSINQVVWYDLNGQPSLIDFIDCGLTPDDFYANKPNPDSLAHIIENGTVVATWHNNEWT